MSYHILAGRRENRKHWSNHAKQHPVNESTKERCGWLTVDPLPAGGLQSFYIQFKGPLPKMRIYSFWGGQQWDLDLRAPSGSKDQWIPR